MRHLGIPETSFFTSRRRWMPSLLVLLLLSFSAAWSQDQAAATQDQAPPPPADSGQPPSAAVRAVRLSDVEGKVQILSDGQADFDQAQMNMPVMQGMRLKTGDDGKAEIQFEDGSVARVTPNSALTLTELKRADDGHTVTTITADGGLTYYELNGQAGQYTVRLAGSAAVPSDSSVFRVNLDQNPEFAVMHGTVKLTDAANNPIDVQTNQTVKFASAASAQYDVVSSIDGDSWDQWNSDRDQQLAMMGQNGTTARASSENPNDPAWNDLDYYGDWYNVPGYGQGWAPSGVDASWDPFASGGWGYYSGVGYSWVSNNPWGWWPYHCGAWDFFDSFGWMWFPGNCGYGSVGVGWYPYATVWRTPQGYRLPIRPVNPPHGGLPPHQPRMHPQAFVAVNRTPQTAGQFRTLGEMKPPARAFSFNGQAVHTEQASVHPQSSGPTGESFTDSLIRTNPQYLSLGNRGPMGGGGGGGAAYGGQMRNSYSGGNHVGFVPPASGMRSYTPSGGGQHFSAPSASHFSAPAASSGGAHFSAPAASAPSGGGHPR